MTPATDPKHVHAGDLAILTYRRQRVLHDVRDPSKRGPFATRETFLRKYTPGALPAYRERWANRTTEPSEEEISLSDAESRMAADGTLLQQMLADNSPAIEGEGAKEGAAPGRISPALLAADAERISTANSEKQRAAGRLPRSHTREREMKPVTHLTHAASGRAAAPAAAMRGSVSLPAL